MMRWSAGHIRQKSDHVDDEMPEPDRGWRVADRLDHGFLCSSSGSHALQDSFHRSSLEDTW